MFMIRVLIKKHLQHQHNLFHNFINFRKVFDQVWLVSFWQVMRNKTNEYVRQQIDTLAGMKEPLLAVVRCSKLTCYGHVRQVVVIGRLAVRGLLKILNPKLL